MTKTDEGVGFGEQTIVRSHPTRLCDGIMHRILFILLINFSLCVKADNPIPKNIEQTQLINSNVGELRFVLHNLEDHPYSFGRNKAEVLISDLDGHLIQDIPIEIEFSQPRFEFFDVNDDGYHDLLVYTGSAAGSIELANVFLFIPKLKKFVVSKTLSNRGLITKSKSHACVDVSFDQNVYGLSVEEWCFKIETGRWKMTKSYRITVGP
jgi:hypothetical protein